MIPVKHIDPDDIALYAMQLLPPDETEEMSLHLQHSAEARRVLAEVYSDLSIFAHSAEMHSPPALARQRLMKHVAREKKVLPPDPLAGYSGSYAPRANVTLFEEEVAKRSVASRVLPWVGWALAAGMAGLSVSLYMQKTDAARNLLTAQNAAAQTEVKAEAAATVVDTLKDPTALHFLLTATDKPVPPQGRVTYLQEKGALVLSWGDSRIGNIIWDDFECAAVLDWEMASLGQPEMDLGWWLYFDRQFSEAFDVPRPAGFASHEETIERYTEIIGRPLHDIFFYEVFSGFRFAVIMARLTELLVGSELMPHDSDMASNNIATQFLAKLLDLPAPT